MLEAYEDYSNLYKNTQTKINTLKQELKLANCFDSCIYKLFNKFNELKIKGNYPELSTMYNLCLLFPEIRKLEKFNQQILNGDEQLLFINNLNII